MKRIFCICLVVICNLAAHAQQREIKGRITDNKTGEGLAGATVTVKENKLSTVTDEQGYYLLQKLNEANYTLVISYVGYKTMELDVSFSEGSIVTSNTALSIDDRPGNEIVVTASKHPEKITNAPASIQVIGTKDLQQFAGSNVGELVSKLQGVEYTRSGVDEITFNARGFNSAFNNKVFQLVDGRNSMSSLSGGLAVFNNGSTSKDDIERVEVVLGPQSALYGPNAHNALFNFITKDPRKYQGTIVAISAGSQQQFSGRFRHALKINDKWAYKLSGEFATGQDYKWYDSVYAGNQNPPGTTPFYGPAVTIPERINNFTFDRYRGEAHLYYRITPKTDIILSSGGSQVTRLQVTTTGRNHLRNVGYSFLQAKLVHPRFFVNVYNTWGDLGRTLIIANYTRDFWNRTHSTLPPGNPRGFLFPDEAEKDAQRWGNTIKEKSQRLNAEMQYNYHFQSAGLFLVAGTSYQKDSPNGFGISLIDSFQKVNVTQYGAVLQLEKELPLELRLIAAMRYDHHSNLGNFFSPKFALTKAIANGSFRITWGRAYSMPSIQQQYSGINRFLFGNGKGIYYIPNGTNVNDKPLYKNTTPLKPEEVNTWEVGYKGTVGKKLFIDISYYNGVSKNFISPTITVFGRALKVGDVNVIHNPAFAGTVQNDTLRNAQFFTYFNYGTVRNYGIDIGLNYTFNKFFNAGVKYSWFGSDITNDDSKNDANGDRFVSPEEKSLNAPANRAALLLNVQNLLKEKLFVNITVRYVQQYDFYSANQIGTEAGKGKRGIITRPGLPPLLKNFDWGPLGGFTTVDISAGYQFNQMIRLNMGVTNLFNTRQIEFVGSPSIGRLFMFELKAEVPHKK